MTAKRTTTGLQDVAAMLKKNGHVHSDRLDRAIEMTKQIYADQQHWSGQTMIEHVESVLETLMPFEPDEDAVIGCMLHHALTTDECTLADLEEQFGPTVRTLVSGVHLLSHVTIRNRRASIDDLRLMLLTVSNDLRTVLINLCDRVHLMRYAHMLEPEGQRRVAQDAIRLFAPVAARLGIYSLKHELENRAFPFLYPDDHHRIDEQMQQFTDANGNFLSGTAKALQVFLAQQGIDADVQHREKLPYSIFSKMRDKSLNHISDIYDFYALRVIVNNVEECYQSLGYVHQFGRPVPNRFKDYISFPKPNGYQSLHTTVAHLSGVPEEVVVEVQVRTKQMQREADLGVAAHWSYKQYGSTDFALEQAQLQQMLSSQEASDEGHLVDQIYVLTPSGDIVELPEGASPLDFAFSVHSELGLSYKGSRVNGVMVPLTHELENGDIVEILKNPAPKPSAQWLQFLHTSSAKTKLKRYLYAQERPIQLSEGRKLVNDQLRKRNLPVLDADISVLKECDDKTLSVSQREDILVKIGQGSERAASIFERAEVLKKPMTKEEIIAIDPTLIRTDKSVRLADGLPMPTRFAKCCKAESGERVAIVGVVNRTGTITIHRDGCGMLRNANKDRLVPAKWIIETQKH